MFSFSISSIIFWIKGRVEVDNQAVRSRIPRLLLWIFPYGMLAKDIDLNHIKNTSVSSKTQIFPLTLGIILILLGTGSAYNHGVGIGALAIFIGIILVIASLKARLVIENTNGHFNIDVPVSQKNILFDIEKEIQNRQKQPEPQIKDNQILEEL